MELTRIDAQKLKAAADEAAQHLDKALELLAPYLVELTEAERRTIPRARDGFDRAGRALVRSVKAHPEIAEICDFDADAVIEDLDNVGSLVPLGERVAKLAQRIADSGLLWTAEAWLPSLAAYAVAKARKNDPALQEALAPLAEMFVARRSAP